MSRTFFSTTALIVLCLPALPLRAQDDSGFKFVEVEVLDPQGQPVAEAEVNIKIDGMEFPMPTDEQGKISLNVPSGQNTRLEMKVKHDEYALDRASWRGAKSIPEKYSFKLEKGVEIGGLVQNEQDEPIEGVDIIALMPQVNIGTVVELRSEKIATTDTKGRWKIQTKDNSDRPLQLKLTHDEYISTPSYKSLATWDQLKKLDHVLVLKKGIEIKGRVTDELGEPIAGAIVYLGSSRYVSTQDKKNNTVKTDADGKYGLFNVRAGNAVVTVAAQGWAPELVTIPAKKGMEPVDFELEKGQSIRILVTDPDGEPISNVGISADDWRGHRSLPETLYRGKTNTEGVWQSSSMPKDQLQFDLYKRGHMSSRNNKLSAHDEPHTLVMQWPLSVSGKVVDAESGEPLENFNVVQGIDWGNPNQQVSWQRHNMRQGQSGKYEMEFTEPYQGHVVRIEAAGYRPEVSRVIRSDEGEVTIDFEMEEGAGPSGIVKTPDGKPAKGVELLVATPQEGIYIYNGHAQQHEGRPAARSDAEGKYQLPFYEKGAYKLVCRHETGYAMRSGDELEKNGNIDLVAWSSVEGKVMQGKNPVADEQVQFYFNRVYVQGAPQVSWNFSTKTDDQGKFRFNKVIGDEAVVARSIRFGGTGNGAFMSAFSHSEQVKLVPGETTSVQLGGQGRTIRGKLKVPDDYEGDINWSMGSMQIYEHVARVNTGGFFQALGRALVGGNAAQATPQQPTFRRSYASPIDETGGFALTDVLPGSYQLSVQLYSTPENGQYNWRPIGNLHQQITIPESEEESNQEPVDLGEFTLNIMNPSQATFGLSIDAAVEVAE